METYFERLCAAAEVSPLNCEELSDADQGEVINCLSQFSLHSDRHASTRKPGHFIEIGFFDDSRVNAFAATWEGCDAIAISWGVVTTLREAFRRVMVPGSFSWIPDDKKDAAADWLFRCSKFFIFLHEMGHIWNGHTSLLNDRGVAPFIFELGHFGEGALGNLDRQTMEMDADGFAAANIFLLGVAENKFPATHAEIEGRWGDGGTQLVMVSMAVYFVFRLFDASVDFDNEEKYSHPSPPLRQLMIAGSLAAHAEKTGFSSFKNAWDAIFQGIHIAEEAYAKYAGKERDDKAISLAVSTAGMGYQQKLLRHWHILRPQLDEVKRGGVLPAIQEVPDDPR